MDEDIHVDHYEPFKMSGDNIVPKQAGKTLKVDKMAVNSLTIITEFTFEPSYGCYVIAS